MFDESKHPRAPKGSSEGGRFTSSDGAGGTHEATEAEKRRMNELGITKTNVVHRQEDNNKNSLTTKVVKVDMDSDIQRQFDKATPKERQKIAFRYIMDNLRGKYPAEDGRIVTIEKVGADKMSHTLNETKIRVLPALANLIEAGKLEGVVEAKKETGAPHRLFKQFAYYKVSFKVGNSLYTGLLNVGIRADGSSTLYDLNPFDKQ